MMTGTHHLRPLRSGCLGPPSLYKCEWLAVLEKIYLIRSGTWLSFKWVSLLCCPIEYIPGVEPENS